MTWNVNIEEYKDTQHRMYITYYITTPKGNIYSVYKDSITTYNGLHKDVLGYQFIITDETIHYKETRSTKKSVINYLSKH